MKNLYFFILVFLASFSVQAQILNIPDVNFKNKLIINGFDTNNDGEIQQNEALTINYLYLNNSNIVSLEGIQNFTNLNDLDCSYNPFTEINLNGLNNLEYLTITNTMISYLDCSLSGVLRLDCSNNLNLTYINVKNNHLYRADPDLLDFPFRFENLPLLSGICLDYNLEEDFNLNFTNFNSSGNVILYSGENCDIVVTINPQAISDFKFDSYFNLYPNPVVDNLIIETKQGITIQSITIYNTLGQLVKTQVVSDINSQITIDVASLKTGTYFISILSDKGKTVEKFIKL